MRASITAFLLRSKFAIVHPFFPCQQGKPDPKSITLLRGQLRQLGQTLSVEPGPAISTTASHVND